VPRLCKSFGYPTSWSPDGRVLAVYGGGVGRPRQIWMLHRDADKWTRALFIETSFEERGAIFSPDGHWVRSNRSGQNDIYARPYAGPGGEVTISAGGGGESVWAPTARELFYRHDGKLLAVRAFSSSAQLRTTWICGAAGAPLLEARGSSTITKRRPSGEMS
jgi:WD40-like Beta Propeller Repeat